MEVDRISSTGDDSFADLIAYRWRLDDQVALIVTNLGAGAASGHISVIGDLPRAEAYDFVDKLNAVSYHRPRKSLDVRGLSCTPAFSAGSRFHRSPTPARVTTYGPRTAPAKRLPMWD